MNTSRDFVLNSTYSTFDRTKASLFFYIARINLARLYADLLVMLVAYEHPTELGVSQALILEAFTLAYDENFDVFPSILIEQILPSITRVLFLNEFQEELRMEVIGLIAERAAAAETRLAVLSELATGNYTSVTSLRENWLSQKDRVRAAIVDRLVRFVEVNLFVVVITFVLWRRAASQRRR